MKLASFLALKDFERAARKKLPRPVFGYVAGAAEDNLSSTANEDAFSDLDLIPQVLMDVSARTQQTTLLGRTYAAPFGIAPMGLSALSAYRGDIVQAVAARKAEIPMVLSGSSLIPMEEVIAAAPGTWFQAYLPGETARIDALLDRARKAGFHELVVTVDIPVAANRENNIRTGFSTPLRPSLRLAMDGISHPRWLAGTFGRTLLHHGMPHFENSFAERGAPILSSHVLRDFTARDHFNWAHIRHIRQIWKGPLIIKGILHPSDARLAQDNGVDAIIVSNHGGRQLDGAIAPLRILPDIVAATTLPVMIDSGFRRGSHILKALALGAAFVFVGRPFNYAAALGGEAGVSHAIGLLKAEIDRDMAMLGARSCREITRAHIRFRRQG
ncbi:alpha-hydroxy-acid oxidizing protein [Acetobacter sp. TBRC 12305]|uniref:Alpha-hydroxy-acid oxidizing protein n=1 Tax=Acetobacter garciniae TaxID=2817435 RepID=A0A939HQI6_9PROT|nr:alpha-hydroxy acid oxidase [Acetobacter garciniae]MBO1325744.1 alpha-hydroxy-acid oxidizing protein [Acetobacter garciniae]MBX0345644.1 alpha-hydroxy-acid oxidizing protein [Acetobacter garciniae]